MQRELRKATFHLGNITYKHEGFTNNLTAGNATVARTATAIRLSLDLSSNESRGSEQSHSYMDAKTLKEDFADVDFIQIHRQPWLDEGLRRAMDQSLTRDFEIELLFKDGTQRVMAMELGVDDDSLWFHKA